MYAAYHASRLGSASFSGDEGRDCFHVIDGKTLVPGCERNHTNITDLTIKSSDGSTVRVGVSDTTEYVSFGTASPVHNLTEDLARGIIREVSSDELWARTSGSNTDRYSKGHQTANHYYIGTAGGDALYGNQGANGNAWANDVIEGGDGNDLIGGGGGKDYLYGGDGNDEVRAGYGHDMLHGERGSDILYGGGWQNTFLDERDGSGDAKLSMMAIKESPGQPHLADINESF